MDIINIFWWFVIVIISFFSVIRQCVFLLFLILFIYFLLHKQKTYYLCTQRMRLIMDCLVSSSDLKRSKLWLYFSLSHTLSVYLFVKLEYSFDWSSSFTYYSSVVTVISFIWCVQNSTNPLIFFSVYIFKSNHTEIEKKTE